MKKLIVLSYDSLQSKDLEKLQTMPFFSEILERAAVVRNIREIYPTLTYPIHTTIVTGLYPDKHGIAHNQKPAIDPKDPDFSIMGSNWYWRKDNIRGKTLTDSVLEEGRTAATVLWPVTAGEKRGWNLPEIWPTQETMDNVRELYADASSGNVMSEYFDRFIGKYRWRNNEDMVCYAVEIALDIVRRQVPDLLLCHLTQLDHIRHVYGVQNREVDDCLRQLDVIAGRFIDAARDAGTLDETNFVILGDHGQIDVAKVFHLNALFRKSGLIRAADDGKVFDYEAYSFSAGFSAHVIMKDPKNEKVKARLCRLLDDLPSQYPQCIEAVYTSEDMLREEHLAGEFSFVVEAREGVLFANDIAADVVTEPDAPRDKPYKAMHGHHPSKGEKPPFVAFGPDVKTAARIENGSLIDIAPTLAALVGVTLPQAEGKPFPLLSIGTDTAVGTGTAA
jgi:predicted AlkP superfamily pyrophosphatase or phosphodiesterase